MESNKLIEALESYHQMHLPFVVYSLPDSDLLVALFQKDEQLHITDSFTARSFLFAPFNFEETACCIPEEDSEVVGATLALEKIEIVEVVDEYKESEKEKYLKLVNDAIHAVTIKSANKIVVSRRKVLKIKKLNLSTLIHRLFNLYPDAFRYLWYHPKTGLWCGATPEILVRTEDISFNSMALAGTQKLNDKIPVYWNDKEIEEHQFVTDAITTSLQKVTDVLRVSKTYTHQAGTLLHLRTDITGILKGGKATLKTISSALHPTPAVCGTPKKAAKNFILEHEGYDREFYTGFVGPICGNNTCSNLFVNLRCVKIEGNTAVLYSGGGITSRSNAEDEWEETRNKLQTMLQVIQPMI